MGHVSLFIWPWRFLPLTNAYLQQAILTLIARLLFYALFVLLSMLFLLTIIEQT